MHFDSLLFLLLFFFKKNVIEILLGNGGKLFQEMHLKFMNGSEVWIRDIFYKPDCCFFMYACLLELKVISGYFTSQNTNIMLKATN